MGTPRTPRDKRIISLASEVADTRDRKVPSLLLCLKEILDSAPPGTPDGLRLRKEIWEYDILRVLVLVLKQDFSVIDGEWFLAAKLCHILCQITSGLELSKKDKTELKENQLPAALENFFLCARRIQARYTQSGISSKDREELLRNFKEVLEGITRLTTGNVHLVAKAFQSAWLLQLLITDDVITVVNSLGLIQSLLRANSSVFYELEESLIHTIIDELIYKLTVNNDQTIGGATVKCVLKVCDHYRPAVKLLSSRYRGLRPLLVKWRTRGFDKELRDLYLLLDAGTAQKAESQKHDAAALAIQSHWRSFRTREQLKKADRAFRRFHKKYRKRREELERTKFESKRESELEHMMKLHRQRIMREFNERQLHTIEILPAGQVESYLEKEKDVAAVRIQKSFKGYRTRKGFGERKQHVTEMRAAVCIQRSVRRWLERVRKRRKEDPKYLKAPGLDDAKRLELQQQIIEWRELNPTRHNIREELEKIHNQSAEMLGRFYKSLKAQRQREVHRDALVARLETDSELLSFAPKLQEADEKDVERYTSQSVPVQMKAKANHTETLKRLQLPWWKLLSDEYQDKEYEEEDFHIF